MPRSYESDRSLATHGPGSTSGGIVAESRNGNEIVIHKGKSWGAPSFIESDLGSSVGLLVLDTSDIAD